MRTSFARILVPVALAAGIAGCGGGDGSSSPLDDALGYLPDNSPLAIVISTDLEGDRYEGAREYLERFPAASNLLDQARQSLEGGDVDYEKDVEPILGNDMVIASPSAETLQSDSNDFILTLASKDEGKLEDIAKKDSEKVGETEGATIYQSGDTFLAVDDGTAVLSGKRELVEDALKQRGEDDRLREEDVEKAFEGLPDDAIARVYADLESILEADPETADARKIEWLSALRTLGVAISVDGKRAQVDFAVNTDSGSLSEEDLPFATGDPAPAIAAAAGEIGVGIRNVAQIVRFGEQAAQAVDPDGYSQYVTGKRTLGRQIGIDIDRDVLGQLTGDTSIAVGIDGSFAIRARVRDAEELDATLEKVAGEASDIARELGIGTVGVATPRGDEDFYAIARPGGDSVVFGVVDDVLVVASDPGRAGSLAAEDPTPVDGAKGAITFRADAGALAQQLVARLTSGSDALGASLFTGALGESRGSAAITSGRLIGRLSLDLK